MELVQDSGLSKMDFAQLTGVSQGVMSHISSGRNNPGTELLIQVLEKFPKINAEWLLLGKGSKIKDEVRQDVKNELLKLFDEVKLLNSMNYQNLTQRIESIERRIAQL